jgi:hypothetical protein
MLRERTVQRDYWDVILPDNVRRMSPELDYNGALNEGASKEAVMAVRELVFQSPL